MKHAVHFSRATDEWATPAWLFRELDAEFHFTLDAAASAENTKCLRFFTAEDDGLQQDWDGVVWCNPPYSRLAAWLGKAADEAKCGVTSVFLVPARTDTAVWHDLVWDTHQHRPRRGVEVRFLRGRLKFGDCGVNAPFPSALIVFRPVAPC